MAEHNLPMRGKTCMVTGATRGLGRAAAVGLARMGARVVIVGRSPERIESTLDLLRAESAGAANAGAGRQEHCALLADLSSMAEIRRAARQFLDANERLDVLINNVGATNLRYQESPDGHEMTWALNYLGHFLLTHQLLQPLQAAARSAGEARVVELTSSMLRLASPRRLGPQGARGYNGVLAYAQSKRAINLFTLGLAQQMAGRGVMVNAVTPGAVQTGIADAHKGVWARLGMWVVDRFSVPLEQGVQPILRLAAAPEMRGVTGGYYQKHQRVAEGEKLGRAEDIDRLWRLSQEMTA